MIAMPNGPYLVRSIFYLRILLLNPRKFFCLVKSSKMNGLDQVVAKDHNRIVIGSSFDQKKKPNDCSFKDNSQRTNRVCDLLGRVEFGPQVGPK